MTHHHQQPVLRRKMIQTLFIISVTFLGVFSYCFSMAQRDFKDVIIEPTNLGGGVYMLTGAGGNLGLFVGKDATILIDDQFAPLSDKITAAIKAITDQPVTYLFNTHFHGDHTGGNENFGKAGAKIIAQDNVRARLKSKLKSSTQAGEAGLPVITFSDEMTLYLNEDTVQVLHIENAHTDGDAILWFKKANIIHMGDTLFSHRYPFIDRESGGHIDGIIAGYDRVLGLMDEDTKLIAGHGPLTGKADLQKLRKMLNMVRGRIKYHIESGKNLEETLAAEPLSDLEEEWAPKGAFVDGRSLTKTVYLMLADGPE